VIETVELFQGPEGRWRWRYRAGDTALESNESYDSAAEAQDAARIAYPGVSITGLDAAFSDPEQSRAISWLALLLIIVVLLRARKER
jgi:uncharacterized protein YegP (UPF0339 family)